MTGPLTLSGDPTATNHAANRHYIDTGLTGKANVVNGLVPTGQLGSGAADGSLCLKGNSSWGACGTSADAVSIRGTTVGTAAPTDGQVITYEASSNTYKPKPGATTGSVYQTTKFATDFQFTLTSTTDLTTAGAKTVTLTSCPAGVRGDEADYWVYVSGTGTAEAAKVTGGTCVGDGNAGTLQFTTVNGHATGYTIASASAASALAVPARAPVAVPIAPPTIAPTGPASAAPFAAPAISPAAAPDTGLDGYPGAGTAYCAIAALDVPAARATTTAKTLNLVAIITSLKQDKSSRLSRIKKLECLAFGAH